MIQRGGLILIRSQDKQLRDMAPTVESAEKSYSSVVTTGQPAQPVISSSVIQQAVKVMAEEEERSNNVIIFGLKEQDEENVARQHGLRNKVGFRRVFILPVRAAAARDTD